jgi:hypothetical protein
MRIAIGSIGHSRLVAAAIPARRATEFGRLSLG